MSKEAAMRAMREARYRERSAAAAAAPRPVMPAKERPPVAPAPDSSSDGLCGHRSMNGRTCTREQGHAAKSYRYS